MSSHFLAQSLLLCLLVYADFTYSKVHYIRPSLDSPCPQNASSCLTLSQFAANSSHNETDMSLLFLPGNHTLDRELLLAQGHKFSMSKYAKDNECVFVECISQLGRFDVSEATSVSIKSLHFIGCGSNRVSQVTWLTIADSVFQDVEDNNTVLELNGVDIANIERSQFLYNTIDYHTINISKYFLPKERLDYIYHQRNRPGGALYTVFSNVSIISSWFMHNRADIGGALVAHNSSVHIDSSTISYNAANFGVAMFTSASTIDIDTSTFTGNIAHVGGGVMVTYNDKFTICNTNFIQNIADFGGVMSTFGNSSVTMNNCNCTSNDAKRDGGVMETWQNSLLNISNSTFTYNSARYGGGVMLTWDNSSFTLNSCTFTYNNAYDDAGGVMVVQDNVSFNISNSTFTYNSALYDGGVIVIWDDSSLIISNSTYSSNQAITSSTIEVYTNSLVIISHSTFTSVVIDSAVIVIYSNSVVNISNSTFINNKAISGAIAIILCFGKLNLDSSNFSFNTLDRDGGIILSSQCSTDIVNCVFDHNVGSLVYTYNSNLTLSRDSKFENSHKALITDDGFSQGGVITSYLSTVVFARYSTIHISSNQTRDGGAILAIESTIIMYGETTIANNNLTTTANSSGGGISLKLSRLEIKGNCTLFNNSAMRGGGIHVTSSTISVYQPATLKIINNNAELGGGMYLEVNSKLYVLKEYYCSKQVYYLNFFDNHARYGGAVYVDDTNSITCSAGNECFIQTLKLYTAWHTDANKVNIFFSGNTATPQGSNLFGGLLDRCIPSQFAELDDMKIVHYSGVTYLQNISNNTLLDSISSKSVRVCFCNSELEPDCSYQLPTITVRKGEAFNVSVVAVDQINNTVDANISSSLSAFNSGFGEGQH